jgi:GNAT superfamily N-acetyltransferase
MPRSCDLMTLHVEALYTHDTAGRIVRVNEHDGAVAPRFFLGQTHDGLVRRYRDDVDDATQRALEAASGPDALAGSAVDAEANAAAHLARYAAILARSGPVRHTEAGPAFAFPRDLPAPDSSAVLVTDANVGLLSLLLSAWVPDVRRSPPLFARVVDGQAVAVCASVRITPDAHEAGVETAAAFRGRGYATQVVAAWARAVRASGVEPLYSTAWQNAASRAVARKLGLVQFGSDLHVT